MKPPKQKPESNDFHYGFEVWWKSTVHSMNIHERCNQAYEVAWQEQQKEIDRLRQALEKIIKYHKDAEGDIFLLCQPDKGNVFSTFDGIRWEAEAALKPSNDAKLQ